MQSWVPGITVYFNLIYETLKKRNNKNEKKNNLE